VILGYTVVEIVLAVAVGLLCVVLGLAGRKPGDASVLPLAAVELALVAQIVVAIVAPFAGNPPSGNPIEFWAYLVAAAIIPPGAVIWALTDRTRWGTVVLGIAALAVAVMLWRMQIIWTVQGV
jgi:hypothetical protein